MCAYTNNHVYPEGCFFKDLESIRGKKVTVMGLGLNGGGEACTRFFARHGAVVTVTDMKTAEQLAPTLESLKKDLGADFDRIRFVLGKHELSDFENADCVIKNPGIKYEGNKFLAAAKAIETDISLFLSLSKAPVIAVTGSKGKSSTVSAIHYGLLQAGKKAFLGGNITVSPLTFLEQTDETTPVVLELSSWQLADLRGRGVLKPKIAVLTKIVPDHQNWYGAMEPYVADKKLIYADQTENDFTLCMKNDEWGETFASETKGKVVWYGDGAEIPVHIGNTLVPGAHMKQNLTNAALVLTLMGVSADKASRIMESFPGIPHRLEFFHSTKNSTGTEIRFYNDSASTVPDSVAAALNAFEKPPVLLAGGTDKGLDFLPFVESAHLAKKIYLLEGTGTDKILPFFKEKHIAYSGPYGSLKEMLAAVKAGLPELTENETTLNVVFSPGATSFGMFTNEFDRGNQFKALVKESF